MSIPFRGCKPLNPKGSPPVTAAQVREKAAALRLPVRRGWQVPGSGEFIETNHGDWFIKLKSPNSWVTMGKTNLSALQYLEQVERVFGILSAPTPLP
jgi:hypothetical protein